MRRLTGFLLTMSLSTLPVLASAATWTFLEHPSLVNQSSGPDGLWGTADDISDLGGGVGANPNGSATIWSGTVFGADAFFSGGHVTDSPASVTPGSVITLSAPTEFEVLGLGTFAGAPLDPGAANTWTIGAARDVTWDLGFAGGIQFDASGYLFLPGEQAASIMGAGPVAEHVDFMLDLLPANFIVAAYMAGDFSGNLSGRVDGLVYATAPVPLPAPALLLGTAMAAFGLGKRSLAGRRLSH